MDGLAALPHRNFTALIVGSGKEDYRRALLARIFTHNLKDVVKIVDECRDMPAAFALADLVVSASTRPEGFGRVIVEAQAMGCPVIATDHGGARETVLDGQTGWLMPPNDAQALTAALENALRLSVDERRMMGERGMAHVRANFTTALMTARTLAVYEEVLATRGKN